MITFTSLGGLSFKCVDGSKPLIVFPEKSSGKDDVITLLSSPEETTTPGTLSWPGEYNVAGVSIRGVGHAEGQQVSYVAELDGVRCAMLSSPLQDLNEKQIEMMGEIDVLVIPADETKLAQKLVDEFDPRILLLVPSKDANALSSISKAVGAKPENSGAEYKIKGSLPMEGREVWVLRK